jgi:hypothetical protein
MPRQYKNDKEIVKLVTKWLERLISDFNDDMDDLSGYWDTRHERFEFLVTNGDIRRKVASLS